MFNCDVHMHMETMRNVSGKFLMLFLVCQKRSNASFYKLDTLGWNVQEFVRTLGFLAGNKTVE